MCQSVCEKRTCTWCLVACWSSLGREGLLLHHLLFPLLLLLWFSLLNSCPLSPVCLWWKTIRLCTWQKFYGQLKMLSAGGLAHWMSKISELESGWSSCRAKSQCCLVFGILQTRKKSCICTDENRISIASWKIIIIILRKKKTFKPSDLVGRERLHQISRWSLRLGTINCVTVCEKCHANSTRNSAGCTETFWHHRWRRWKMKRSRGLSKSGESRVQVKGIGRYRPAVMAEPRGRRRRDQAAPPADLGKIWITKDGTAVQRVASLSLRFHGA